MKKVFLILLLCLSYTLGYSQFKMGIKAGLSTTNLDVADLNILDAGGSEQLRLAMENANYGIHAGLIIQARFGKLLFQPEILFNSNSVDFSTTDLNQSGLESVKNEKYQYLDIPLLFGAKFGPLRLMVGPEGHYFINSSSELLDFDEYDQNFKEFTFGYLVGVGLDIWNLRFDVRYEGNFSNFGDHIIFDGVEYEFDNAPSRVLFSLGLMFGE